MNKTTIAAYGALAIGVVAIILSVVGLGGHQSVSPAPSDIVKGAAGVNPSGGNVYQQVDNYVNGLVVGGVYDQYVALVIPTGSNQASWTNNTGQSVYANGFRGEMVSATSTSQVPFSKSTLQTSVGTSTTATVTAASLPNYGSLIDRWQFLAGTQASNFVNGAYVGGAWATSTTLYSDYKTTGPANNQLGIVRVDPGQSLIWTLYDPADAVGTSGNATSSLRGFNLAGYFNYSY